MQLNNQIIEKLAGQKGCSQNQLAYEIGVGRGSLSNALSGKRGVGRKTLVGLLKIFPNETVQP